MAVPTIYQQLASRFKTDWLNSPTLRPHYDHIDAIKASVTAVKNHQTLITDSGLHTPKAILEQMRAKAVKDLAPIVKRSTEYVDGKKAELDQRRKNLTAPKAANDPVAEMRRAEIRSHLKTLSAGDRIAAVTNDPDVANAYLDAPGFLSGATPDERANVDDMLAKQFHGDALQEIETQRDALGVVEAVIGVAVNDLQKVTGFENSPREFAAWMDAASPPKPTNPDDKFKIYF